MNAGRELDRIIAEKVMGWKIIPYVSTGEKGPAIVSASLDDHDMYRKWPGDELWSPSRDIKTAWEVAGFLQEKELLFEFALIGQGNEWQAGEFEWTPGDGSYEWRVIGESPAHAICLAALCACGIESST
jgi:hypothetical protein